MDLTAATYFFRKNYTGPKIAFLISGGGYSCLKFRQFPGASSIIEQAIEPYSGLSFANFLNDAIAATTACSLDGEPQPYYDENSSFCNQEILDPAIRSMENYVDSEETLIVVVTAALTTNRYRLGENRAFIGFSDGRRFKLSLPKINEPSHAFMLSNAPSLLDEHRFREDSLVGQVVLALIMNDPNMMPNLPEGASLENLTPTTA